MDPEGYLHLKAKIRYLNGLPMDRKTEEEKRIAD